MQPYFDHYQPSALFFVSLTLAADMICTALILGTSQMEYKAFAARILNERLGNRYRALRSIFDGFSDHGLYSKESWLRLCEALPQKYFLAEDQASAIFNSEDAKDQGSIDFRSFVRLCVIVSCKVKFAQPAIPPFGVLSPVKVSTTVVDGENFLTSSALVTIRNDYHRTEQPRVRLIGHEMYDVQYDLQHITDNQSRGTDRHLEAIENRESYNEYSFTNRLGSRFAAISWVLATTAVSTVLPFFGRVTFNLRNCWFALLHLLLLLQLSYVSSGTAEVGWYHFGKVLEVFFLLDMVVQLSAYGFSKYMTFNIHKLDFAVNIAAFVSLICLGNGRGPNAAETLSVTVFIQTMRFCRVFFMINDVEIFEMMVPVLLRAGCLLFSILYFFAIFAHTFFCSSLSGVTIDGGADDDASDWNQFALLLNFSSYWQSLLTVFEMGILGECVVE